LQDIINDPKKRKKLIIYINPPYAEATSTATRIGTRENKTGVATGNKTHLKYANKLGKARNELFAQFLARIYFEIPDCKIGTFSTLKELVSPNFKDFRNFFLAKFKKGFIVPAYTFDNVKGNFQIGFNIWDTEEKTHFKSAIVDIYGVKGVYCGKKTHNDGPNCKYINDWIKKYKDKNTDFSAKLCYVGNDFQNQAKVQICSQNKKVIAHDVVFDISINNIIVAGIYFAVRRCIEHTWINHRDQFLHPNNDWETDEEFQNDCLAYTLFHGNNNISTKYGTNHWIPFTEYQVGARDNFDSSFMTDFITGKTKTNNVVSEPSLFYGHPEGKSNNDDEYKPQRREFSEEAKNVFKAGKELWKYYHAAISFPPGRTAVNASLYDIKEYFQKRNKKGKMNNKSEDETYNELIGNLRLTLNLLAKKIEPKVYEYGFLKE